GGSWDSPLTIICGPDSIRANITLPAWWHGRLFVMAGPRPSHLHQHGAARDGRVEPGHDVLATPGHDVLATSGHDVLATSVHDGLATSGHDELATSSGTMALQCVTPPSPAVQNPDRTLSSPSPDNAASALSRLDHNRRSPDGSCRCDPTPANHSRSSDAYNGTAPQADAG